jgi:lysyl-tRNA synthetase class 2
MFLDKNSVLKKRANILKSIREFFAKRNVIEVETPLLCSAPVTDPYLHALSLEYQQNYRYLQTSPEYAMKRLLCDGIGDIYQICKAFRSDETGRLHQVEFTILEWYRINFDHHQLMDETECLLQTVINALPAQKFSYQELFQQYLKINPHITTKKDLIKLLKHHNILLNEHENHTKDDYLNILFSQIIESRLKSDFKLLTPIFVTDYPVSQSALAKTNFNKEGHEIAERFEVYINGIELANGYHELQDGNIQRKRFQQDLEKRKKLDLSLVPIDEYLCSALDNGLPACAGIAMGIDRLVMIALNQPHISDVIAFDFQRC